MEIIFARNLPFKTWIDAVDHWSRQHGPIEMRRVGMDKNTAQVFDFFKVIRSFSLDSSAPSSASLKSGPTANAC